MCECVCVCVSKCVSECVSVSFFRGSRTWSVGSGSTCWQHRPASSEAEVAASFQPFVEAFGCWVKPGQEQGWASESC